MCPNFSIASPTLVTVHFLIITIVIGMKWYITVVLIFDSQMINGVECFFMCLWGIHISALKKCIFKSFAHFFIGLLVFLCWVHFIIYLVCKFLIRYKIYKYFLPVNGLSFHFFLSIFWSTKVFHFDETSLSIFVTYAFYGISKKLLPNSVS